MLYRKNIYAWEQVMRILAGVAMIVGGLWFMPGNIWGYLLATAGLSAAVTGIFGYCPACAMVGRKPVVKP